MIYSKIQRQVLPGELGISHKKKYAIRAGDADLFDTLSEILDACDELN